MAPFRYKDLSGSQIRLATLHSGAPQDDIRLSITHVPLTVSGPRRQPTLQRIQKELSDDWRAQEEQPKQLIFQHRNESGEWEPQWTHPDPSFDIRRYEKQPNPVSFEALSYTWGSVANAEMTHVVPCPESAGPEESETSTLPIGINLASALRDLRYQDRPRTLWVDAICINQEDQSEVSVQVARAGTVYEEASRVVIWLGPKSHDSGLAIRTLDYLGSQVMVSADLRTLGAPGATKPDWSLPGVPLGYDAPTWTAIDSLLRRPWFTRVWIQQELHLADQAVFVCGEDKMSRDNFWRATRTIQSKLQLDPAVSRIVLTRAMRVMLPHRSTCTIYHITSRAWNGDCKDERDLIYGALGLFPPSFRSKIAIDYSSPSGQVYTSFVKLHIDHVKRLEMLRLCDLGARRPEIPSWVPDFCSKSSPNVMPGGWHFSAGHSACEVEFHGQKLQAVGVQSTIILSVSEAVPMRTGEPDETFEEAARAIRKLITLFQAENTDTELGARPENFIWALLGTFLPDRLPENLIGTVEQLHHIMKNSNIFGGGKTEEAVEGHLSYPEYYCLDLLSGRRVCKTAQGHMGIAPEAAQEGDIIACFLGCEAPLALRHTDEGYLVVGECFMPDLADLRAFLGPLPSPWKVKFRTENTDGAGAYHYFNTETGESSDQDPRVDTLPDDLEVVPRAEVYRTGDDPCTFQVYRSRETGAVVTKSDPMLTRALLEAKGCPLRQFLLI